MAGWFLSGLFVFRVVAQPLALVVPVGLPAFESWHSATMPYGVLLSSQILILAAMIWTNHRLGAGTLTPRRVVGLALLAFGALYFVAMLGRLVLGLTILRESRWFASPIPTVFHLVLASWLLLVGRFNWTFAAPGPSGR